MQILLKLRYKGLKIAMLADTVVYAGMFLLGGVLKWFKPHPIEYQTNRATITYLETKYIFAS